MVFVVQVSLALTLQVTLSELIKTFDFLSCGINVN